LDPLLHTRLQPSSWKFFTDLLPRLSALSSSAFVTPTKEAWSLVERETVIDLYEKFFFQSDVGAYPMFHMPSLIDMPGFLSMRAQGKQPMREVHLARDEPVPQRKVLRSAKPEAATTKAILVAAAATAATNAALAAATKPVEPKGLETKAVAVVAAGSTKSLSAVGHEGGETKAKQTIAAEVWRNKCSTCAKAYHPVTRWLDTLLESIPAKGKLTLQAGVLTHTRTPAHPHTRTRA